MTTNEGIDVLRTQLSPAECERRLAGRVWRRSVWSLFTWSEPPAARPLLGNVTATGFHVRRGTPYSRHNSWRVWATGAFAASSVGTNIFLKLSIELWVVVFEAVWLAGLAAAWLLVLATEISQLLRGGSLPSRNLIILVVPPLMGLSGLAAMQMGRASAASQRRFLLTFLRKELEADESVQP